MGTLDIEGHFREMPVGNGVVEHSFGCPSSCSRWILNQPVTVFMEYQHAHETAVSIHSEVIRQGNIVHVSQADFFSFEQQSAQLIQQEEYTINPGDSIRLVCTYSGNDVEFGPASTDEMCVLYLAYYPRQKLLGRVPWLCGPGLAPLFICVADHDKRELDSLADINRSFGSVADQCEP
jgi:hypothetical protein